MDAQRRARWLRKREIGVAAVLVVNAALSVLMLWAFSAAWPVTPLAITVDCAMSGLCLACNAIMFVVLRRKLRAAPYPPQHASPLQLS